MKIGIVGDIHWSKYSSILRRRGNKYSVRLENCIESINWAESTLEDCDLTVYLGDFFDSSDLTSEELTALNDIKWNNSKHILLVGNHEMGINNLSYSSSHTFGLMNFTIIDTPINRIFGDVELCFIPYLLNSSNVLINDIFPQSNFKRIVFSHNDISGIQMGKFISESGFDLEDIDSSCDLFINGHLHNGEDITEKIINIGNLTGQNFSEDATKYKHKILKLDTDNLSLQRFNNPYALNFYKINYPYDISKLNNSVLTVKVNESYLNDCKKALNESENILSYRIIVDYESVISEYSKKDLSVNHLEKFEEFVRENLGNSKLVCEELEEVLR